MKRWYYVLIFLGQKGLGWLYGYRQYVRPLYYPFFTFQTQFITISMRSSSLLVFFCFIGFRYYDFFFPFSILPTSTLKPYVITVSKDVHNFILLQISVTHKRLLQTVAFMEVRSCPPSRYIDHSPTTTLMTFTSSLCIPKSPSHPRGIPTPLKQCISGGKMGRFLLPAFLLLFDFIPFSFFSCVAIFF